MKYIIDHDYHIHSQLSYCSLNPEQTNERILKYAEDNGFSEICLTNHFWDHRVEGYGRQGSYDKQSLDHILEALPLPKSDKVRFYFGGEGDMDKNLRVGVTADIYNTLDFLIVPTTHMHMPGFTVEETDTALERRAELYVKRFYALFENKALIPERTGIAHMTDSLLAWHNKNFEDHLIVLDMIPDEVFKDLFEKTAQKGFGVELNFELDKYTKAQYDTVLRPYFIAKDCGCKFYLGSDAHHPSELDAAYEKFCAIVEALKLEESDKFKFATK